MFRCGDSAPLWIYKEAQMKKEEAIRIMVNCATLYNHNLENRDRVQTFG